MKKSAISDLKEALLLLEEPISSYENGRQNAKKALAFISAASTKLKEYVHSN